MGGLFVIIGLSLSGRHYGKKTSKNILPCPSNWIIDVNAIYRGGLTMYDLLMLSVVILPPLLTHLVSRRYCRTFDDLAYDEQAQQMYRMSWLTSILIFIQTILPLCIFAEYFKKMTLFQEVLKPLEAVIGFPSVPASSSFKRTNSQWN
jgi:hypothetical protein